MPLTRNQPELARLPDDEPPRRVVLCLHRAWLARRSAELNGKEPAPVTSEPGFDGRAVVQAVLRKEDADHDT